MTPPKVNNFIKMDTNESKVEEIPDMHFPHQFSSQ
jgi:hypothetical protein